MPLSLWLIFITVTGACVGSFVNVVVYRLPTGRSIVRPPSHCPACGYRLAWWDNVPILAWFYLRGKCRKCGQRISFQYPMVELVAAVLFGGWFVVCYFTDLRPDFAGAGLANSWPVLAVYLVMWAALLAGTLIDARYFIIPIEISWVVMVCAIIVMPLTVWLLPGAVFEEARAIDGGLGMAFEVTERSAAPLAAGRLTAIVAPAGAVLGLLIANLLLRLKMLPRSFADLDTTDEQTDDPDTWAVHPHPRREVLKEGAFLALPIALGLLGYWLASGRDAPEAWSAPLPAWRALGGVMTGLLVGGGVVWITRILGTLAFGKEAMGLGDVHLMAAVGAVCGWRVAVLTFFVAPFIGLAYAAVSQGVGRMLHRQVKVIPYGPHLAAAAMIVCIFREMLLEKFGILLGV